MMRTLKVYLFQTFKLISIWIFMSLTLLITFSKTVNSTYPAWLPLFIILPLITFTFLLTTSIKSPSSITRSTVAIQHILKRTLKLRMLRIILFLGYCYTFFYYLGILLLPFYLLFNFKINSTLIITISGVIFYLVVNGFYYGKNVLASKKLMKSKVEINARSMPELSYKIKSFSESLGLECPPKAYLVSTESVAEIYIFKGVIYITTNMIELLKHKTDATNFIIGFVLANILRKDYFDTPYFVYLKHIPIFGYLCNYLQRENVYSYDKLAVLLCGNADGASQFFEIMYRNVIKELPPHLAYQSSNFFCFYSFNKILRELQTPFPSPEKRLAKINNNIFISNANKFSILLLWIVAMIFPNFKVKPFIRNFAFVMLMGSLIILLAYKQSFI